MSQQQLDCLLEFLRGVAMEPLHNEKGQIPGEKMKKYKDKK